MRYSSLARRAGHVDAQAPLLRASLIAAHAATTAAGGFRATDVRFFFRLFGNWLESDVMRPSLDIELTQIRRVLEGLVREGHVRRVGTVRSRDNRARLSASGLLELADKLIEECGPDFEETLFVLHFAASYRDILRARVVGAGESLAPSMRKRLATILDGKRIVKRAVRNREQMAADLRQRLADDRSLEGELERLRATVADRDLVTAMSELGGYQLERVQPLKRLMAMLPADLRRTELATGIATRRERIFEPLLARTEVELRLLRGLADQLGVNRPS